MRPLRGVVLKGGSSLTIRMESGLIINHNNLIKAKYGDVLYIMYDFTQNKVKEVELALPEGALIENEYVFKEKEHYHMSMWEE